MLEATREVLEELKSGKYTEDEARKIVESLPQDEKMSLVYELSTNEVFDDIKHWSIWFVDFLDKNHLVNDYTTGKADLSPVIGMMLAGTRLLQYSADDMARQELQAQTEHTQWGMTLSERISSYMAAIYTAVDELASLHCHYKAVLKGRGMEWHFQTQTGEGLPYTEEQKMRNTLMRQEAVEDFRAWLKEKEKEGANEAPQE